MVYASWRRARYHADVFPGIILSGGASRRMGSPKALLTDSEGQSFVARCVRSLRTAGLAPIIVVTGPHHDAIVDALRREAADVMPEVVRNPDPDRGQLSSLWTGMDASPDDAEAIAMTLVDVPSVTAGTIRRVADAWLRTRAPIVRPIFKGRRGHPVVFDRAVFDELRSAPLDAGARVVVRAHLGDSVDVPVDDPGCVRDVDTPADYDALVRGPD